VFVSSIDAGKVTPSPETIAVAREILKHGDPLKEHVEYATKVGKVHGGEKPARSVTMSTYSGYLPADD
jgi:hypothetical protein